MSERVWQALTKLAHLREWTPYEADGSLSAFGTVKLVTMGAPATPAIADRLADYRDGHAPADMLKRFADVGSFCA